MSPITVETTVYAPVEKVWEMWNGPEHIPHWAFASDDWEAPSAENDVREGGTFKTVMAAKDRSAQFDFTGTYTKVVPNKQLEYVMDDGRKVSVTFEKIDEDATKITETFDPENENTEEVQQSGWQAILDNFKKYAEANS